MINVYDKVMITDSGKIYSSYGEWARVYKASKWVRYKEVKEGTKGIVMVIARHLIYKDRILALVDVGECEIIIDINALSIIERRKNSNIEFVARKE